jgi:YjbE family integral membrane protein
MRNMFESVIRDLANLGTPATLVVFVQVLIIDITLAGDNVIVVGALAAGLPAAQRRRVIAIGVLTALVLRVTFALTVAQLLRVIGLVLAGGLLLLWVAWKMWRELVHPGEFRRSPGATGVQRSGVRSARSFAGAAWAVALADVSMGLDNVLGVAGAAKSHPGIMIVGLFFAVMLMAVAANIIARYIDRYRWIAWVGIVVVLWVSGTMIWEGVTDREVGLLRLF